MAIFTRRDIQKAIDKLNSFFDPKQSDNLIRNLNGKPEKSLPTEWEAVIISSLSQCGNVTYEKNHGGKTNPDLLFSTKDFGSLEFLADITCVSDKDKHKNNPYDYFCTVIRSCLHDFGAKPIGLYIDVFHKEEWHAENRKLILTLPSQKDIPFFVQTYLCEFLSGIAKNPNNSCVLNYDKNGYRFDIRYNANEKLGSGGSHISYTVPYSTRNPLFNALIKKGIQLNKSQYKGSKGIIICDGGCDALNERPSLGGAIGCQETVEHFLKKHTHILWILVLRLQQNHAAFNIKNRITIKSTLFWNPCRETELLTATDSILKQALLILPEPKSNAVSALSWLNSQSGKVGRSFRGNYHMSNKSKTIKISARMLTDLFAGEYTYNYFRIENPKIDAFFKKQIANGNTLKNAFVEKCEHEDDDWIILEYDGPDAAISPFHVSTITENRLDNSVRRIPK